MKTQHRCRAPGQTGFTLVELMVALVVGMMVIAALLAGYFAISVSNRHTRAMTQMSEDAGAALSVLRSHLAQAGYSRPVSGDSNGFQRAWLQSQSTFVRGCDSGFTDPTKAIGLLACEDSSGNDALHDAVSVAYEADTSNSITSGGVPLDCLGNALTLVGGANSYYLNTSTFYLDDGVGNRRALFCRGSGGGTAQALVENVEDLQILYGVRATSDPPGTPVRVAFYGKASKPVAWANVVSVRLCVVVASSDEVMDDAAPYYDCSDTEVVPNDKRMYRAFRSTVLLHNRLGAL
ncbi:MAG: PilW family protein [Burkholderiales bacterium]|nr:PilW family protein [Burkholderiales bacterium]